MINTQNMPIVLQNYMNLENDIDINNLKILSDIFDKVDNYEIKSTNVLMDDLIIDGLIMKPKIKRKTNILLEENANKFLNLANKKLEKSLNNINEVYFYNTFVKLVKKFNYIDFEEQVILNFLFEEIKEENKNLQEVSKNEKKYIIK